MIAFVAASICHLIYIYIYIYMCVCVRVSVCVFVFISQKVFEAQKLKIPPVVVRRVMEVDFPRHGLVTFI